MKPVILILILTIILATNSIAQDYQSVNSRRVAFFENKFKNVESLRIDSIVGPADSTFIPAYVIQGNYRSNRYCISPYLGSWIGKSITIKQNGFNEFINRDGEKIIINTKALINGKWTAFQNKDLIVEAKVLKHDTMTFLGIKDSVKTIGFQAYDKNKTPLSLKVNEMTIALSKNYGFVKTLGFYLFPNVIDEGRFREFEEYKLIGIENPKLGFQNLKWFDVYDFQIGDELHVEDYSSSFSISSTYKTIFKYLARITSKDSLVYRVETKQMIIKKNNLDTTFYSFKHDTITQTCYRHAYFDRLPGEAILVGNYEIYAFGMTNGKIITKSEPPATETYYSRGIDTCFAPPVTGGGCFPVYNYLEGLGGPYFERCEVSMSSRTRTLVYFKKGNITDGNPYIINGLDNYEVAENMSVYPNPASENVYFKINQQGVSLGFELSNIQGKLILSNKIDRNENSINIKHLENGIYFYKLILGDKVIKTGKLIKTNSNN